MAFLSSKFVFQAMIVCQMFYWYSRAGASSSCYTFHNQRKAWSVSEQQCQTNNGHLVSMETDNEWKFIDSVVQNKSVVNAEWYIGLVKGSDKWHWVNNHSLTINRWRNGQPSQSVGQDKCVVMAKSPTITQWLFNNIDCSSEQMFICEYDKAQPICRHLNIVFNSFNTTILQSIDATAMHKENRTSIAPGSPALRASRNTPSKSSKTAKIIIILFGVVLLVCVGLFLYVFCWKFNQPGYSGEFEIKNRMYFQVPQPYDHHDVRASPQAPHALDEANEYLAPVDSVGASTWYTGCYTRADHRDVRASPQASHALDEVNGYSAPVDSVGASTWYTGCYTKADHTASPGIRAISEQGSGFSLDFDEFEDEIQNPKINERHKNESVADESQPSPHAVNAVDKDLYATVDVSNKTKKKSDQAVEVVYAKVDKSRKTPRV